MLKKWYCISVATLSIFIVSLIILTNPTSNLISTNNKFIKSEKPKTIPIAKIIIPKINIDNSLYSQKSDENTVEKNIMILDGTILPNNSNSIIFLAAHSGNGSIAYFNDLDQLKINDTIIFQYKKYNYYYYIDKIYEEDKDGDIEINKSSNQQLVLTTCSKTNSKKQLIINSNLFKKEEST